MRLALVGADDAAAIDAAAALGASGAANAAEPLVEVLAAGAAPARAAGGARRARQAGRAGALPRADQTTLDALELYAGHRAPDVRRRAIKALGTFK